MNDTAAYTRHPVRLVRTQPLWIPELGTVRAGFPSPAEDLGVKRIDLAEKLIRHPQATFYWRARGHAMQELGISDGDLLIVEAACWMLAGGGICTAAERQLCGCRGTEKI